MLSQWVRDYIGIGIGSPLSPHVCSLTLHVFPLTVASLSAAPALSAQDKALLVTALHCAAIGGWVPCADEKSSLALSRATAASAARPSCVGGATTHAGLLSALERGRVLYIYWPLIYEPSYISWTTTGICWAALSAYAICSRGDLYSRVWISTRGCVAICLARGSGAHATFIHNSRPAPSRWSRRAPT